MGDLRLSWGVSIGVGVARGTGEDFGILLGLCHLVGVRGGSDGASPVSSMCRRSSWVLRLVSLFLSRTRMTTVGIRLGVARLRLYMLAGFAEGGIWFRARSIILLGPCILGRDICLLLSAFASCDACNSAIEVGFDAAPNGLLDP